MATELEKFFKKKENQGMTLEEGIDAWARNIAEDIDKQVIEDYIKKSKSKIKKRKK